MTKDQFERARHRLGLTQQQMASMLGYVGRQIICDVEAGRRPVRDPQRRLIEAYLAGYRPKDWPQ